MNAARADSYASQRLLELLGIERFAPRSAHASSTAPTEAATVAVTVGGAEAPRLSAQDKRRAVGASAPPTVIPYAIACGAGDADRYAVFVGHLSRAIGVDATAFTRRIANAPHTICFGTAPPDGPATLAPPLSALRASPQAKRAFWRTLRDLKRAGR